MRIKSVPELQLGVVLSYLDLASNALAMNPRGSVIAFEALMRNVGGLFGRCYYRIRFPE